MTRPNQSLTISLSPDDREKLNRLAQQFDCLWGDKPNLSELLSRIAQGKIKLEQIDAILCPSCNAKAYKNGFNGAGLQKYHCPQCHKNFQQDAIPSPQDRRRKRKISAQTMKVLQDNGESLQEISQKAGISKEGVRLAIQKVTSIRSQHS